MNSILQLYYFDILQNFTFLVSHKKLNLDHQTAFFGPIDGNTHIFGGLLRSSSDIMIKTCTQLQLKLHGIQKPTLSPSED